MSAWVMRVKDFNWWHRISNVHYGFEKMYILPLFNSYPINNKVYSYEDDNELILVVDGYIHYIPYSLEQIEEINKTWNKFYEDESKNKET